jgi:hypothetical protein
MYPNAASQRFSALSSIASNTGARFAWRAVDDLQYLGGRSLLFQRLTGLSD